MECTSMHLNWLAIIVATLAFFMKSAIWYSFLFNKTWIKEQGYATAEECKKSMEGKSMTLTFGLALVFSFVMALGLGWVIGHITHASTCGGNGALLGMRIGIFSSIVWVTMSTFLTGIFAGKSWKLMLITAGDYIVGMAIMGAIIGGWQ